MDDHTPDQVCLPDPPSPQAPSLRAPMAFDATTRHRRVYTHPREEPGAFSPNHVTLDVDNQHPNSLGPKDRRRRRKGRSRLSTKCDTSLPIHSVAARCWYVPVRLHGIKL